MVADVRGDVLALDDRLHERPHLGLGGRERTGALLLGLGSPVGGPVPVQVEALQWRRDGNRDAVPVADRPLGQDAVEVAFDVVRESGDEQARVVRMRFPRAVPVGHAHEEHAAVSVDVLPLETVLGLVAWIRAHARATEAPVGEARVGSVRVHARDDVERAGVDRVGDALVLAVAVEQAVEEVQRRGRARELHRVDLGVDEDGRLLVGRPGLRVRHGAEPDVASLVRLAHGLEAEERRELRCPRFQRLRQLGIRVEAVEADAHERARYLPCARPGSASADSGRAADP